MAMVKLSIKPGRSGATYYGVTRYAQQPEYGIFRWARANRRLKAINTLSLTLITQSCETYLIQNTRPELITDTFREFFDTPVETAQDVHKQLKRLRRVIARTGERETPVTIYSWVAAATRYQLLKRGVISNTKSTPPKKRSCKANRK